jgi:hypothetical protein
VEIVSFELKGGLEAGRQFLDALNLFSLTANLGDTRSIATHPASTTHSKLTPEQREEVGISDGLVRLSIGLEHIDDIGEILKGKGKLVILKSNLYHTKPVKPQTNCGGFVCDSIVVSTPTVLSLCAFKHAEN